jgi:transposase
LALIVFSVVEQRLDAVGAVLAGAQVNEVAAALGVHRATVQRWFGRYLAEQVAGAEPAWRSRAKRRPSVEASTASITTGNDTKDQKD